MSRFIGTLTNFIALALTLAILTGCATSPYTGRRTISLVPRSDVLKMGLTEYRKVIQEAKLSTDRRKIKMLYRVGARIARSAEAFMRDSGQAAKIPGYRWEFNLIDDPEQVNAWCMPGGKIAVYTGLLPVTRDETGLAVVIGHEVAHALAEHGRERMSQTLLTQLGGVALSVALADKAPAVQQGFMTAYGLGAQVGYILPYSRTHEYEADRIGLILAAQAGYDPRAAIGLWQRMNDQAKTRTPELLATHPAPDSRIREIKRYLPEAMRYYRN